MDTPLPEMPEIDDYDDIWGDLYVEDATSLLYEVKFFSGFVIARPASPMFYSAIRKLSDAEFAHEFREYWGDHEEARKAIQGMPDVYATVN